MAVFEFKKARDSLAAALQELGFMLTEAELAEVRRGKDFIQLRNGLFDPDLVFAPDGVDDFNEAWRRRVETHELPVALIDDIIGSKQAANRQTDRGRCRGSCRSGSGSNGTASM